MSNFISWNKLSCAKGKSKICIFSPFHPARISLSWWKTEAVEDGDAVEKMAFLIGCLSGEDVFAGWGSKIVACSGCSAEHPGCPKHLNSREQEKPTKKQKLEDFFEDEGGFMQLKSKYYCRQGVWSKQIYKNSLLPLPSHCTVEKMVVLDHSYS